MDAVSKKDALVVLYDMVDSIRKNRDHLSKIDGLIGDGDHGINMSKGFTEFEKKLDRDADDLASGLKKLGQTLLNDIGGSMGPLYGSMFISMSKAAKNDDPIDAQVLLKMLESGLETIQRIGNAKVGDKTLVDVLDPAVHAFRDSVQSGDDFRTALASMCAAADAGLQSTIDMVAKLGRASRLGERSRGVQDAGATSCQILLCTISNSLTSLMT